MTGQRINTLAWSPDGKWLAAGLSGSQIILWDMRQYRPVAVLSGRRPGCGAELVRGWRYACVQCNRWNRANMEDCHDPVEYGHSRLLEKMMRFKLKLFLAIGVLFFVFSGCASWPADPLPSPPLIPQP